MKGNVLTLGGIKASSRWCDKDHVLLCACFQVLVDFIEKERPQTIVDFEHDRKHRKMWKEMRALYRYWKVERPLMGRRVEKALRRWARDYRYELVPQPGGRGSAMVVTKNNEQAWTRLRRLEERFDQTEDGMLRRLVNIRRHLWC